jgi:hypothetical protein
MLNHIEDGYRDRTRTIRNVATLIVFLAGGWRTYQQIDDLMGWKPERGKKRSRTSYRNVRALEDAGLPLEWRYDPESTGRKQAVRLPKDWVGRAAWLKILEK